MSWLPEDLSGSETRLSTAALLAVGKALNIANNFESLCKHVLRISQMASYIQDHGKLELEEFNKIVKAKFLDGTIKDLGQFSDINADHIGILERAKDARNYIAHESAIFFDSSSKWLIVARLKNLRQEVTHLAHGANLVHLWSYEIENRRRGPRDVFDEYPKVIDQWVFGRLIKTIKTLGDYPKAKRAEEIVALWSFSKGRANPSPRPITPVQV